MASRLEVLGTGLRSEKHLQQEYERPDAGSDQAGRTADRQDLPPARSVHRLAEDDPHQSGRQNSRPADPPGQIRNADE